MKKFDLTKQRKGSMTPFGKISVCPKCGKKGAIRTIKSMVKPNGSERKGWTEYHHHADVITLPGLGPIHTIKDYCSVH